MSGLKVGIFGGSRGMDIAKNFMMLNCDIVAVCENRENQYKRIRDMAGEDVVIYDDFDKFIEHDMDCVVLANFFHEHAPYAIRCIEKGLHVYSECISNGTMAEGVELVEAFEKHPDVVYMLAENYPQMKFNREIKRIVDTGSLGKILFAEAEYNHPGNVDNKEIKLRYIYKKEHWRNYLPRTYYVTHSLGPVMFVTGATPKRVTAFNMAVPKEEGHIDSSFVCDMAANITTINDDGSVFRFTGCAAFGAHHNSTRVCGTKGSMENIRGMGDQVMLRYNGWEKPEGAPTKSFYDPNWNDEQEALIMKSGHGGGDFLTARIFVESIENKVQPPHPYDIYSATVMSSVAILGHRSSLEGGMPYDIPDFKIKEDRDKYREDRLSPFINNFGEKPSIQCCSDANYKPDESSIKRFEEEIEEEMKKK